VKDSTQFSHFEAFIGCLLSFILIALLPFGYLFIVQAISSRIPSYINENIWGWISLSVLILIPCFVPWIARIVRKKLVRTPRDINPRWYTADTLVLILVSLFFAYEYFILGFFSGIIDEFHDYWPIAMLIIFTALAVGIWRSFHYFYQTRSGVEKGMTLVYTCFYAAGIVAIGLSGGYYISL
jgi:hypothetical protein